MFKKKKDSDVVVETIIDTTKNKKKIKEIIFEGSGWCEELQTSYRKGIYTPKTLKEYNILKKYGK